MANGNETARRGGPAAMHPINPGNGVETVASTTRSDTAVLEARAIARSFGAVAALRSASLSVRSGEVVGLVGDNGAGKSTLVKILSGAERMNSGTILIDGKPATLGRPADALAAGIETVYQDLALVDTMTPIENVYLNREMPARGWLPRAVGFVDDKSMRRETAAVLDELEVKVPSLKEPVGKMSGGQRQCLAIARAVLWGRRVVILDEPTAALGVRESEQVVQLIRRLRERDIAIIVVSHNMEQLFGFADRVVVMRLGQTVATRSIPLTTREEVVALITGALDGDPDSSETTPAA